VSFALTRLDDFGMKNAPSTTGTDLVSAEPAMAAPQHTAKAGPAPSDGSAYYLLRSGRGTLGRREGGTMNTTPTESESAPPLTWASHDPSIVVRIAAAEQMALADLGWARYDTSASVRRVACARFADSYLLEDAPDASTDEATLEQFNTSLWEAHEEGRLYELLTLEPELATANIAAARISA